MKVSVRVRMRVKTKLKTQFNTLQCFIIFTSIILFKMMIFNQINPLYFFVSLFIGLFFGYVTTPEPTIIIKYPTPDT